MLRQIAQWRLEVDLFDNHQLAQTQVARTSAIILRKDIQETLCYYLLGDNSYFTYMHDCLSDAANEYGAGYISRKPSNCTLPLIFDGLTSQY